VLGFDALQLSSDRDPLAPHARPPAAGSVDLEVLVRRGLLRDLPQRFVDEPPRIAAHSPRERAALGYLDANCGACHSGAARIPGLDLDLSYSLASTGSPAAITTTVGSASRFRFQGDAAPQRITPGDPERSVLARRMASRHALSQMPPIGTHAVDAEAFALVRDWIREDLVSAQGVATTTTNPLPDTRN
jgi:mono/diheme cytochrome c family protein